MATARSTAFSSSRTLPGQVEQASSRSASGSKPVISRRMARACLARKWAASSGTSSARSRSGGRRTGKTLSR